ncbi:MAG: hypothetical protein KDI01_09550 [Halioglobus sp.]|nr:hypothetical protein [Halioglobus sp.]
MKRVTILIAGGHKSSALLVKNPVVRYYATHRVRLCQATLVFTTSLADSG